MIACKYFLEGIPIFWYKNLKAYLGRSRVGVDAYFQFVGSLHVYNDLTSLLIYETGLQLSNRTGHDLVKKGWKTVSMQQQP